MAADANLRLEIGHVLFIDIVGYSKLLIDDQREVQQRLNEAVRNTLQFRDAEAADKLVRLPTGDGMALVFFTSPEAPIECALQVAEALKNEPDLKLRMGINTGPVSGLSDVNDRSNIAGAGINVAQRVMSLGDAGHILISKRSADDLAQYRRWQSNLHDLGEAEVKHGTRIAVVNFYTDHIGNREEPAKLKQFFRKQSSRRQIKGVLIAGTLLLAFAVTAWFLRRGNLDFPDLAAVPAKSIAVLPFENISTDKENVFFTDGVHDEILTHLAKVADLKVISRTSVMTFRETKRNLREIAEALGVAHILEGSVQRDNGRVRVSAQLIDARSDTHLWAERYDRELSDVFAIQSEIAQQIVAQLKAAISPKEQEAITARPTADLGAYDLYLQAKEISRSAAFSRPANLEQQAQLLERAVARDPTFISALCLLARVHLSYYWFGSDKTPSRLERAKKALDAAVRLQPNTGEVHLTQGIFHYWGNRDYETASAELALAHRALPNDAEILTFIGAVERRQGRWEESTRHFEEATILDPRNANVFFQLAWGNYAGLKRYADATRTFETVLSWQPNDFMFQLARSRVDVFSKADLGRQEKVVTSQAAKMSPDTELVTRARLQIALAHRDYQTAYDVLSTYRLPDFRAFDFITPREFFDGIVARGQGDPGGAQAHFLRARERAALTVAKQPEDVRALIVLAEIDANLGRKGEAMREAEYALELLPVSKDTYEGPMVLGRAAGIYSQVGESGRALDLLEQAAKLPHGADYGSLKLDEVWDPLRGNPRFEKILALLAPKM